MYPAQYNIKHYQGDTLDFPIWYRASGVLVDLTGCTAKMQLRTRADSTSVALELSTTNGRILLGDDVTNTAESNDETANMQLIASATVMAGVPSGQYVYDLEVTDTLQAKTTLLTGVFIITAEVTR